ncbi:hypothetical protein CI109_104379 [Kwoniella shandongensis]|uniref:Uncharacterized protein n=1 Tax=Kwoniella shandongensis TaxID=1734106 RepID=A0A5M6BWY9_9TREE|nr:uncharacterized protein CI109_004223 [Kwoniella shandongensis]KAA5527407.1 hypothetical protein CI109_004223 [Kwoniella shandongensis]
MSSPPALAPGFEPPSTPTSLPRIITTTPQRQSTNTHSRRPSGSYASPIDIKPKSPAARRMSMTTTSQAASLSPESVGEKVVGNLQLVLAGIVSSLMLTGIMYSIVYQTSLDTSQIHHHHLPHRAPYFARKSNLFNTVFVKRAWGWTSILYLLHLFTAPQLTRALATTTGGVGSRTRRFGVWLVATLFWALFARWLFGAGLGDRIIALTGGNCALALPKEIDINVARNTFSTLFTSGVSTSTSTKGNGQLYLPLPGKFCTGTPLTPSTFPDLFNLLPSSAVGAIQGQKPTDDHVSLQALPRPRWHKGFDISGHAFLLTLSIMILARELEPSWRSLIAKRSNVTANRKSARREKIVHEEERGWLGIAHVVATVLGTGLTGIWLWMVVMTAVYFHNPPEKLSGLALGLFASFIINTLIPTSTRSLSPYDPTTTTNTTSSSNFKSSSSTPIRPLSYSSLSDENAARRGAIVDDGVIYETEEEEEEEAGVEDSPSRRVLDRKGKAKAKLE